MKKTFLLSICCFVLTFYSLAQNSECTSKYNTAIDYFNKGEYATALVYFKQVKENCGEFRGVSGKIKECEDNLKVENKPDVSIGKSKVGFAPQGGTETVRVKSGEAPWSYGKAPEWLKLSKNKGHLVMECEGNDTGAERSSDITLYIGEGESKTTKKVRVTQSASLLNVSSTALNFPEQGSVPRALQVESNDDWDVASQSDRWFSVTKTDEGVSVSCAENPFAKTRNGVFSLATSNNEVVSISITQDPANPTLELDTSIRVSWNKSDYFLSINTNDPDWDAKISRGGSWCRVERQNEHELHLIMDDNETGEEREVVIRVSAAGIYKDVIVTKRTLGYKSSYEDYFVNMGGTWKITPVSANVYGGGSWGLRVSGYMVRWKVVELDVLNLNASISKSFRLSWEPMIRGYLPLQSDKHCWTIYLGYGRSVNFVNVPLNDGYIVNRTNNIFELGAEFKWKINNTDNISSRIFFRFDNYATVGVSFDLFKWK